MENSSKVGSCSIYNLILNYDNLWYNDYNQSIIQSNAWTFGRSPSSAPPYVSKDSPASAGT